VSNTDGLQATITLSLPHKGEGKKQEAGRPKIDHLVIQQVPSLNCLACSGLSPNKWLLVLGDGASCVVRWTHASPSREGREGDELERQPTP
jgi:hypothetical protein